jgi:ABC-2 type transport system permease protein
VRKLLGDTWVIARREMLRYRRDRAYWAGQLVFPLVVVGFIGFGLDRVVSLPTGTSYLGHLAAGMVALLVGSGGVGAGFTLIQDRESGFLRVLLVAPISRAAMVLGKITARVLASALLVALLVALLAAFTPLRLVHAWALAVSVLGITAVFVALGVVLAARLRSLESFRVISALVTVPIYFVSGIFYPVSTLPLPMRTLAHLNPLTYGVDLLRYGLLGAAEVDPRLSAALLALLTVVGVTAAVLAFDRPGRGA